MENNSKLIWKNSMNYGAVGGVSIAVFRLFTTLGNATFSGISILRYLLLAIVIIRGTKFLRNKMENNDMKYSRALWSGILISMFAGLITGFYVFVEFQYIKPELMNEYMILQEEAIMKMTWLSDGQIEEQIQRIHQNVSSLKYGFEEIFNNTIWGFIMSLIIAIFLKKEKTFANTTNQISETT